jgi:hypothetical protein
VISRGLSVDPARRFVSMRELLEAIERATSGESSTDAGGPMEPVATAKATGADDYALHTMEVERVLEHAVGGASGAPKAVEASLLAFNSGRPALGPSELKEVALEAGIDPEAADRAARQLVATRDSVPTPSPAVDPALPALPERALTGPPEAFVSGMQSSVVSRSVIRPTFNPRTAPAIARTLDRAFGERGDCEFIGHTFVWNCSDVEVTLAPNAAGTIVVLERDLSAIAKKKRGRSMKLFGAAGFIFSMIISEVAGFEGGEEAIGMLLTFVYTSLGIGIGALVPRRAHRKRVKQARERLNWTAQRIEALLDAQPPLELEAATP